jgi:hypothetical protein
MKPSDEKNFIPPHLRPSSNQISLGELEMLRSMTCEERFRRTCELTTAMINQQRQVIREANPQFTELEVKLAWAEQAYGKELIDEVRVHMAKRGIR